MQRKPIKKSMSVNQICKMIKSGKISFENPLQRPAGQWKIDDQSLLIDSLITMCVPDIFALNYMDKDNNYNRMFDIIDGKQRLSSIASYIENKWALTKLNPIQLEPNGEIYDISGKKFMELPEDIREEIKDYMLDFKIIELEGNEDDKKVVKELFLRLNNEKPVSQEHKTFIEANSNIQEFVRRIILEHKLFREISYFTPSSIKKSDKEMTIMQSIILVSGIEYKSFRNKDIKKALLENEISKEILELTEKLFDDIVKIFPQYHRQVSKMNIPILVYILSKILEEDKKQTFHLIQKYFNEDMRTGDKYKSFCISSTANKINVIGRINTLKEICDVQLNQAAK